MLKKLKIKKIIVSIFLIFLLIIIIKKNTSEILSTSKAFDKKEILLMKDFFSSKNIVGLETSKKIQNEDLNSKILKISNNIYFSIEDELEPDLELLTILSNQMKYSPYPESQKLAEQNIKNLIIQFSYLSPAKQERLNDYYHKLKSVSKLNNSKILKEILSENPNSTVNKIFILNRG